MNTHTRHLTLVVALAVLLLLITTVVARMLI
jgi:hypothetical protein